MDFIVVVLSLCSMAAAHLLHSLSPRPSLRPSLTKFRPVGPIWNSNNVINSQNLHPTISISQPIASQQLVTNLTPIEDEHQAAQDLALFVINNYDRTGNLLDLSSSPVQNKQLPYSGVFKNPKYFQQTSNLPGYYPNSRFPEIIPIPMRDIPSPLGYYLAAARQGDDVPVPKWTSFEKTAAKLGVILKTNMINPESTNLGISDDMWLNDRALYTLLVGVVLGLMDEVAKGEKQYDESFDSYLPHVLSLMEQPSVTPENLARNVWDRMTDIDDADTMVKSYIGFMNHSIYCKNSSECDRIIDDAFKKTTNKRLQDEAKLLLAQHEMSALFLSNYATEFETHANNLLKYLGDVDKNNVRMKLKPLVLAGAELIKRRNEMSPEQPLDLDIFPKSEM